MASNAPLVGVKDVVFLANQNKWQCKSVHHHRQFTAKVGTIFEDSPIWLDKWLIAVWMITNCKNGISSYEVARDLASLRSRHGSCFTASVWRCRTIPL